MGLIFWGLNMFVGFTGIVVLPCKAVIAVWASSRVENFTKAQPVNLLVSFYHSN